MILVLYLLHQESARGKCTPRKCWAPCRLTSTPIPSLYRDSLAVPPKCSASFSITAYHLCICDRATEWNGYDRHYLISTFRNSHDPVYFHLETSGLRFGSYNTDVSQHAALFKSSAHPLLTFTVASTTIQNSTKPLLIPSLQMFSMAYVPNLHSGILAALLISIFSWQHIQNGPPPSHPLLQLQVSLSNHQHLRVITPNSNTSAHLMDFQNELYQVFIPVPDNLLIRDFCWPNLSNDFIILASVHHRNSDNDQIMKNHPTPHSLTSASCSQHLCVHFHYHFHVPHSQWLTIYDDYTLLYCHYSVHMCGAVLTVLSVLPCAYIHRPLLAWAVT